MSVIVREHLENRIYILKPEISFTYTKSVCQLYAVSHFKKEFPMRNPNWDIFSEVKESVSVPSAAEYYGMSVRGGMTTCIFHEDRLRL